MFKNEVLVYSFEDAVALSKILIDNGNVVLMSMEDNNYVINWELGAFSNMDYKCYSDRNAVVFMSREEFDTHYYHISEDTCESY